MIKNFDAFSQNEKKDKQQTLSFNINWKKNGFFLDWQPILKNCWPFLSSLTYCYEWTLDKTYK